MSSRQFAIIGVPSSAGGRSPGLEDAPGALRSAGLLTLLRELGLTVVDRGDVPRVEFRPDPENPRQQSRDLVCGVARTVASEVERASGSGAFPVVLGGDCTITIGVLAGLLAQRSDLGLVYFDGDLDLNTPDTTPSGFFDGMVTSHILGAGYPELAGIGPRCPLVREPHLVFFGYDEKSAFIDPPELAALRRSVSLRYPLDEIRDDPLAAARDALATLEGRVERILVHFDVDVSDIPAVDALHERPLALDSAVDALKLFAASPRCVGLVVTEFNPRLDADGSLARRLAERLAATLSVVGQPRGRA